jgi:hypothetical protein
MKKPAPKLTAGGRDGTRSVIMRAGALDATIEVNGLLKRFGQAAAR